MERRRVGKTTVEISRLILGCGNFGGIGSAPELFGRGESDEEAFQIMDGAWEVGITTFDTADAYGGGRSESAIGKWIATRRLRPQITTKTFNPMDVGRDHGLSRARIARQIESSLDRLRVEEVEIYLAHEFDPDTPLEETVATFEGLLELGLIKAWGVSNFTAEQLRKLLAVGRPALVQNAYSLLRRADQEDVLGLCADFGVSYTPFGPLAGGLLTGKYQRGEQPPPESRLAIRPEPYRHLLDDRTFDALERFAHAAERRGVSMASLAIAWVLAQPAVTAVVVGPRRVEHLETALAALDLALCDSEVDELAALF
jgi:aryl-alcohol dehydrogenase-like predicted oxidoreductase